MFKLLIVLWILAVLVVSRILWILRRDNMPGIKDVDPDK